MFISVEHFQDDSGLRPRLVRWAGRLNSECADCTKVFTLKGPCKIIVRVRKGSADSSDVPRAFMGHERYRMGRITFDTEPDTGTLCVYANFAPMDLEVIKDVAGIRIPFSGAEHYFEGFSEWAQHPSTEDRSVALSTPPETVNDVRMDERWGAW